MNIRAAICAWALLAAAISGPACAADYNQGDACSSAGIYQLQNDATSGILMSCNGTTWMQGISALSAGNTLRLDNNPASGSAGCLRYNGTVSKLELSNNCSTYSQLGGVWRDDGPTALRIYYSTANIGIGFNNPSYALAVNDSVAVADMYLHYTNNYIDLNTANIRFENSNREQAFFDQSAKLIRFTNANDRPSRITIGKNNLLYVHSATGGRKVGILKAPSSAELDVNGTIAYNGSLVDLSDERFKENIKPIENALSRLHTVNGVSFRMKDDRTGKIEYGVIAQDVEKQFPELVHEDNGVKMVDYPGLIAPLIVAVNEIDADSQALEARQAASAAKLAAMTARIERLENTEK